MSLKRQKKRNKGHSAEKTYIEFYTLILHCITLIWNIPIKIDILYQTMKPNSRLASTELQKLFFSQNCSFCPSFYIGIRLKMDPLIATMNRIKNSVEPELSIYIGVLVLYKERLASKPILCYIGYLILMTKFVCCLRH